MEYNCNSSTRMCNISVYVHKLAHKFPWKLEALGLKMGHFVPLLELQEEPLFQMKSLSFFLFFTWYVESQVWLLLHSLQLLVLMIMQWNRIGRLRKKKKLAEALFPWGSGFCRSSVQVRKYEFWNFFPSRTQLLTRAKISCHPKNDGYVIFKRLVFKWHGQEKLKIQIHIAWKLLKMSHLNFWILAFSNFHQFLSN